MHYTCRRHRRHIAPSAAEQHAGRQGPVGLPNVGGAALATGHTTPLKGSHGATIDNRDEAQGTFLTLSVPVDRLDAGVSLLADVVQRPRFDAQEWKIAQGEMLDWLARREADLPGVASRAADAVLFAPPAGKARPDWSIAALRTFTRD